MNRRHSLLASWIALSMAFTGALNPAFAGGLVSTERVVERSSTSTPAADQASAAQRAALLTTLVAAGVEPAHAATRLAALTDAEIGELERNIASAPAGGLWFVPFLVVAAVIGALISSRSSSGKTTTDLFGNPRVATTAP